MFLQKISVLAKEWNKRPEELEAVARESLLYGMRLTVVPSFLKNELKRVGIDSTVATPLWSGNAYLLLDLPKILCDPKSKIPYLDDYMFAKKTLTKAQLRKLKGRVKRIPEISNEEFLKTMKNAIRFQTHQSRFLPLFDKMYESKDIEQDLVVEALKIINKEKTNLKTDDRKEIQKYLSYCVTKKANTYIRRVAPKTTNVYTETQESLNKLIDQSLFEHRQDTCSQRHHEFSMDLEKILPPKAFQAVSLLMGFADDGLSEDFKDFLKKNPEVHKAPAKLRIEKFLGEPVFCVLKDNPTLYSYLKG